MQYGGGYPFVSPPMPWMVMGGGVSTYPSVQPGMGHVNQNDSGMSGLESVRSNDLSPLHHPPPSTLE